jgi:hypothetical protein
LGLLHALKGVGNRPFYRWLTRDYRPLFPQLPERTRLFRLLKTWVYPDLWSTMPPRHGVPALAGGPCPGLRSCPPAFLALTRVTVDEVSRLVPLCEAALPAQKACCDARHHCRMPLIRWRRIVKSG